MAEQLLERERELAVLGDAFANAEQGRGGFALVVGEAGIGKTSLLQAFVAAVTDRARVLVGACDDLTTPRVLGPFHDMAHAGAPALAAALARGERDVVFPAVLAELDDPLRPVVMVVEDVHWADDATLDVLRYLAGRIGSLSTLVVVTSRESEMPPHHGWHGVRGMLAGQRPHRVVLRGLGPASVRTLAAGTGRDPDQLLSLTDGNPFFLTEVLATRDGSVPVTVADAVLARIRQLDAATQEALSLLAVIPSGIEPWLVERLLPDPAGVLGEAERRGLIQVTAAGVAFRHELARRAMVASMPTTVEWAMHRRVLRAMTEHDDVPLPRLLHHAVAVTDIDTILRLGPQAARDAASAGAHRQALAHYRQVLQWADRVHPAERARLHEEMGWELYNAHHFTEAAEHAAAAVELRRTLSDPAAEGQAWVSLSRFQYNSNAVAEAMASIERAIELLGHDGDPEASLTARTQRGALLELLDRPHEAVPVLDRAVRDADAVGSGRVGALARNYLGCARMDLDDPRGIALLEESIARADALGEQELVVRGYANLCEGLAYLHDNDRLRAYVVAGRRYASDRDFAAHEYVFVSFQCLLLALEGHTMQAEQELRRLVRQHPDAGNTGRYSLPLLARLAARRGSPDAASLVDQAWENAREGDTVSALVPAAVAALEHAWLRGDATTGHDRGRTAFDRLCEVPGRARYRGELSCWLRRADVDLDLDAWTRSADSPIAEPYRSALTGDWRRAADAWARVGDPYEHGLALVESDDEAAMLEGLAILDGLDAKAAAARVRRRLREFGIRTVPRGPRSATRADPHGLTARQAEILGLLAQDLTNQEIAQRLVISVRTVDHHVSAILRTLGVATRQDAARLADGSDGLS